MKFTNVAKDEIFMLSDLGHGEYFRIENNFYIKTDIDDEDGDYYVINLETGVGVTKSFDTVVTPITVKEFIYENM